MLPRTALPARAWVWLQASRPPSQSYIAPPLLLGQLLAVPGAAALELRILLWVQLFGVCDQLFIVYGNDYADRETDALNRTATPFSGGSRVLAERALTPRALLRASKWAAVATVAIAALLALRFGRPLSLPLGVLAVLMLWAYSYRPLSLSYRGGGELLQMVGVGFCLPLFGYYNQAGTLAAFPWELCAVLLPTHLACAMATSLPDAPSDRQSGKRSATVLLGPARNRAAIGLLNLGTVAALWWSHGELWILVLPALCTAGIALGPVGAPGSRTLLVRVALAIATTITVVAGLIIAHW
ncbi:MAG: prenyltransferase [Myxococcales bacterium]|nr:prenyltransferase [Myxococcales bacterium]